MSQSRSAEGGTGGLVGAAPGRVDLVLEGGGVKGTALVGALSALHDAGYSFGRIAGTSSGALVGALVAAGVPLPRLHQLLLETDYRTYLDPTRVKSLPLPLLDDALSELVDRGLYRGDALRDFVAQELAAVGVRTFADLRLSGPEAATLPPDRRYRLVVVASDLTRQRMVRIPWYLRGEYGIDPDTVSVADAVRMSTAIPFFFVPFQLRSQLTGQVSYLVDGGLNSGFPADIFDGSGQTPSGRPTLYIGLEPGTHPNQPMPVPGNIVAYVRALVLTGLNGRDNASLDAPAVARRSIFVDTSYVSPIDFSIDSALRQRLFDDGYAATQAFLTTLSATPGAAPASPPTARPRPGPAPPP